MANVRPLTHGLFLLGAAEELVDSLTPSLLLQWGQKLALLVLVFIGGRLALRLATVLIDKTFQPSDETRVRLLTEQRAITLRGLLKSIASYVINFVVLLTMLQLVGIPTEHVLAGAGILGLAVGFGAQSLVRDIITGFFIIYEDQFGVGDVVEISGVNGTVEDMGFRVTKVRDFDGSLHIIPNGDIAQVNNKSRGTSRILLDVDIAYEEDLDQALELLQRLCAEFEDPALIDGPNVLGVQALGASGITIRLLARTRPLEHWGIERRLRLEAKKALDQAGIEIPYQRVVMVPPEATKVAKTIDREAEH